MGSKHLPPPITTWLPFPWEKEQSPDDGLTDEEINEIRAALQKENSQKS